MASFTRLVSYEDVFGVPRTPDFPFEQPSTFLRAKPVSGVGLYSIDLTDVSIPPVGPQVTALQVGAAAASNRALLVLTVALVILGALVYLKLK